MLYRFAVSFENSPGDSLPVMNRLNKAVSFSNHRNHFVFGAGIFPPLLLPAKRTSD
jgi:hypothetical protein